METVQWSDLPVRRLSSDDVLPLTANAVVDVGLGSKGSTPEIAGRGSYIADFGALDIPKIGEIQARAGLHFGRLHQRGALVLGVRKELRSLSQRGYELSLGAQTVGDDRRLDVLGDIRILKFFRSAVAFYRFLWAVGFPYSQYGHSGPRWNEMGSSLGVSQQRLPPYGLGELTIGWRAGLGDGSREGVAHPSASGSSRTAGPGAPPGSSDTAERRGGRRRSGGSRRPTEALLDSTPYVAYGVQLPARPCLGGTQEARAQVACAVLPEHDAVEHSFRLDLAAVGDDSKAVEAGTKTLLATVEQSMSQPSRARLRLGASFASR